MARFKIEGAELELPRNLALLDTNVLVARLHERDQDHEAACEFFDEVEDYRLLVAPPVIVEACGLLNNRRGKGSDIELLAWLQTPGNVELLPDPHSPGETLNTLIGHLAWMKKHKIDYVDAYLMEIAHKITTYCKFKPYARIVTTDARDYLRCLRQEYRFSLYNMRNREKIDLEFD